MKLTQIIFEDQQILKELHRRNGLKILAESTQGLTKNQRLVVEGVYKHCLPLIEASLSNDQIQQIFTDVEAGATAQGGNRTALGKGKDAAAEAKNILSSLGQKLKDSAPVQNFDAKFKELKDSINKKFPDSKLLDGLSSLGRLAKDNPKKTAAIIGVLTVLAGLSTGPLGGMIAGQVLRGASDLLQGKDASTAIAGAVKTGAIGAVAGGVGDMFGGADAAADAGGADAAADTGSGDIPPAEQAKIDKLTAKYPPDQYEYRGAGGNVEIYDSEGNRVAKMDIKSSGMNGDQFANHVQGSSASSGSFADTVEKTSDAQRAEKGLPGAGIKDPNFDAGDNTTDNSTNTAPAEPTSGSANQSGVTGDQIRNHPAYQAEIERSGDNVEGRRAASLKARAAMAKGESIYRQNRPLSEGQVYLLFKRIDIAQSYLAEAGFLDKIKDKAKTVGKNLTTKVTADKLASDWAKSKLPADSDDLYNFLLDKGIPADVIKPVYDTMQLPVPGDSNQQDAAPQQAQGDQQPAASSQDNTEQPADQDTEPQQDQKPAAQATAAVDVVQLANQIKKSNPNYTTEIKQMLDSDPEVAKTKQPAATAQPQPAA
jgi:hypothetical protein